MNDEITDAEYAVTETNNPPAGMMRTATNYTTAVQVVKPRSIHAIKRQVEQEAMLAGERFYYGWGAGQGKVEGPTVKMALALARCYCNCVIQNAPVQDLPDAWIFTSAFIDLETGFTMERQFRQSKKSVVSGRHDEVRKEDIRFQIGQSKAMRNVVLNALPTFLIDTAMEAAKAGVRKKLEEFIRMTDAKEGDGKGIVKAADIVITSLAKLGVTEDRILAKIGRASKVGIGIEQIITLRGDLAAIEDGESRAEELFPTFSTPPQQSTGSTTAEQLAAKMQATKTPASQANAGQEQPANKPQPSDNQSANPEAGTGPLFGSDSEGKRGTKKGGGIDPIKG